MFYHKHLLYDLGKHAITLKFFPIKTTIINRKGYKKDMQLPSLKSHLLNREHLINWAA